MVNKNQDERTERSPDFGTNGKPHPDGCRHHGTAKINQNAASQGSIARAFSRLTTIFPWRKRQVEH